MGTILTVVEATAGSNKQQVVKSIHCCCRKDYGYKLGSLFSWFGEKESRRGAPNIWSVTQSDIVIVSEDMAMTDAIGCEVGVIGATICATKQDEPTTKRDI